MSAVRGRVRSLAISALAHLPEWRCVDVCLCVGLQVDQFQLIHDFARAYGSLAWNLAKVIPRKDLPKIFSMFTPTEENKKA